MSFPIYSRLKLAQMNKSLNIFKNKLEKLVVGDDIRKAVDIALEMYDASAKDLGLE